MERWIFRVILFSVIYFRTFAQIAGWDESLRENGLAVDWLPPVANDSQGSLLNLNFNTSLIRFINMSIKANDFISETGGASVTVCLLPLPFPLCVFSHSRSSARWAWVCSAYWNVWQNCSHSGYSFVQLLSCFKIKAVGLLSVRSEEQILLLQKYWKW